MVWAWLMPLPELDDETLAFTCDSCGAQVGSVYRAGYWLDHGHGRYEQEVDFLCEACWRRNYPGERLPGESDAVVAP